jgi:hypothetical protein
LIQSDNHLDGVKAIVSTCLSDGRETVKYRLEEDGNTTNFWVDANTKLAVRMEYEMINPTPNIRRNRFVFSDFVWEPEPSFAYEMWLLLSQDSTPSAKQPEARSVDWPNDRQIFWLQD